MGIKSRIAVYYAGSLAVPFAAIKKEFAAIHPDVDIQYTSGGSCDLARKINLGEQADILVSADYTVIDTMLMPHYAEWNAWFAKNSMVIMYKNKSKLAAEINSDNWYRILLQEEVNYGHSDPEADPCGYRTVLLWQLAEKYYGEDRLFKKLTESCPAENICAKSAELIAMLEKGVLDYVFEYESVARQHALKRSDFRWVQLPEEINLSAVGHTEFYKESSINLKGKEPDEIITKTGEPIIYSLTIPLTAQNPEGAAVFLRFLLSKDKGIKILEANGQPVMNQFYVNGKENLPEGLKAIFG